MNPIRIIVLEDDLGYTRVLNQVFDRNAGFKILQSFHSPVTFLTELPKLEAQIYLLDINLPKMSGMECISHIRDFKPHSRILMLTLHSDDKKVLQSFLNGADGYLLKDSTPDQIFEAIEDVLNGGAPMSPVIARKVVRLLNHMGTQSGNKEKNSPVDHILSKRENEILACLAEGKKYKEIANLLFVSKDTVKTHIRHIYEKLQVRNKAEAIAKFLG